MITIKVSDALQLSALLKGAKVANIESAADKLKVVKILKALKPITTEYTDAQEQLRESCKGKNHEEMESKARQWQEAEQRKKEVPFTEEERIAINTYWGNYQNSIQTALDKLMKEDRQVDLEKISESLLEGLVNSNSEWTLEQITQLDPICD